VCVQPCACFGEVLGAEAGNLALKGLTTGGVIIRPPASAPKILACAQGRSFLAALADKGRFSEWRRICRCEWRSIRVRRSSAPAAFLVSSAIHPGAKGVASGFGSRGLGRGGSDPSRSPSQLRIQVATLGLTQIT